MQIRTVVIDRSAGAVEENTYENRFRTPKDFYYWDADNTGDVLRLERRPDSPRSSAPASTPSMAGGQTPVIQGTRQLPILARDASNRIRVGFQMPSAGVPYLLIQDGDLNTLWRKELTVRGPGPYSEMVQLPDLPRGQWLELIVRGADRVVAKYEIR
jgi:hypothetical protein